MKFMNENQRKAAFANMNQFAGVSLRQRALGESGLISEPTEPATIMGMYRPWLRDVSRKQYPHFTLEEWQSLPRMAGPSYSDVKRYLEWYDLMDQAETLKMKELDPLIAMAKQQEPSTRRDLLKSLKEIEKKYYEPADIYLRERMRKGGLGIDIDPEGNLMMTDDIPVSTVMPYTGGPVLRFEDVARLKKKLGI